MKTFLKYSILLLSIFVIIIGCKEDYYEDDVLLDNLFFDDERMVNYFAVKPEDKHLFWSEEFDNNDSKWPLDVTVNYSDGKVFLEDGKMIIDYYDEWSYFELPTLIDEKRNFELEMQMYWQLPPENNYYFLLLYYFDHPVNKQISYCIGLSDREKVNIEFLYWDENKDKDLWYRISSVSAPDFIKLEDCNLTTIRKIGKKYCIFINEKLFYTISEDEFSCNPTGFAIHQGINKLDYFRLSYLKN